MIVLGMFTYIYTYVFYPIEHYLQVHIVSPMTLYSFCPIPFVLPVAYDSDGCKEYVLGRHFRDLPKRLVA